MDDYPESNRLNETNRQLQTTTEEQSAIICTVYGNSSRR